MMVIRKSSIWALVAFLTIFCASTAISHGFTGRVRDSAGGCLLATSWFIMRIMIDTGRYRRDLGVTLITDLEEHDGDTLIVEEEK